MEEVEARKESDLRESGWRLPFQGPMDLWLIGFEFINRIFLPASSGLWNGA